MSICIKILQCYVFSTCAIYHPCSPVIFPRSIYYGSNSWIRTGHSKSVCQFGYYIYKGMIITKLNEKCCIVILTIDYIYICMKIWYFLNIGYKGIWACYEKSAEQAGKNLFRLCNKRNPGCCKRNSNQFNSFGKGKNTFVV